MIQRRRELLKIKAQDARGLYFCNGLRLSLCLSYAGGLRGYACRPDARRCVPWSASCDRPGFSRAYMI